MRREKSHFGLVCRAKAVSEGGIVTIAPGIGAIVAWSPGLDDKANSALALRAIEDLAHGLGWLVF